MPANSGDKDAYVWSWLQNKCISNPYIPDDEPVLKRARYDDDEIGCAWKIATRGFLSHHVFEPRLLVRNPSPEDASIECKDPSKPVVLLLGWAGAKYSHVDKYAEIYNRQGYQTISFVSACYHYRIPNSRYGFYLSPLFRGIDAKPGDFRSYKDCPIIVHSFSMNCVQSLISLWKWTEAGQLKHRRYRIRGIIFDSAPVVTQAGPCAVAVVQSTPPIDGLEWIDPELRRKYINYMFMLRNAEAHPLCYLYPPIRAQLSQFYYMQNYMTLPQPQLYIYSEADEMVKHKSVTRFLEQRKEMTSDRLFCRIHPIFIILFSIQKNMSKHVWISSGEPNWP